MLTDSLTQTTFGSRNPGRQSGDFLGMGKAVPTPALWTPAMISTLAWYDMTDSSAGMTLSGTDVLTVVDKSGNGNTLTAASAGVRGQWDAAKGAIATLKTTQMGFVSLLGMDSIIAVLTYKDGIKNTFDTYPRVFENPSKSTNRILGSINQNYWHASSVVSTAAYNNGASAAITTALPMLKVMSRFAFSPLSAGNIDILHRRDFTDRGWAGLVYEYIVPAIGETLGNLQRIEGYLAKKHNITLDAGHPYYSVVVS